MSETGIINIHGKDYQTVALRVTKFRAEKPNWSIITDILENTPEMVMMKAAVLDESGRMIGTGHAEEKRGAGINKTSALENCETSAIGRALAACGYGGTEYASANEVEDTVEYIDENTVADIKAQCQDLNVDMQAFLKFLGIEAIEAMPKALLDKACSALQAKAGKAKK